MARHPWSGSARSSGADERIQVEALEFGTTAIGKILQRFPGMIQLRDLLSLCT